MFYLRLPERPGFVVTAIAVKSSLRILAISNAPSTTLRKKNNTICADNFVANELSKNNKKCVRH